AGLVIIVGLIVLNCPLNLPAFAAQPSRIDRRYCPELPPSDTAASLSRKLDEYLLSAARQHRFNGAALVARQGKILLNKGYGWRDAALGARNDTDTFFPILSMTKSFTATAIL